MMMRLIDVFVTGDTHTNTVAFQAATKQAEETLRRFYKDGLNKQGVLVVLDTQADNVFDLLDENNLWTETRG